MKLKKFAFLLALSAIWSLQSCDNNDDESLNVPVVYITSHLSCCWFTVL